MSLFALSLIVNPASLSFQTGYKPFLKMALFDSPQAFFLKFLTLSSEFGHFNSYLPESYKNLGCPFFFKFAFHFCFVEIFLSPVYGVINKILKVVAQSLFFKEFSSTVPHQVFSFCWCEKSRKPYSTTRFWPLKFYL
jgi:hypothetical protein